MKRDLGPAYSAAYRWTDRAILDRWLGSVNGPVRTVIELAPGPNLAVVNALSRVTPGALHVAVDPQVHHLRLLDAMAVSVRLLLVVALGSALPLRPGSADIVVLHHAIDDIYQSEGQHGLRRTIAQVADLLRVKGRLICAHAALTYDPASQAVNLGQVRSMLSAFGSWEISLDVGRHLEWLVADKQA